MNTTTNINITMKGEEVIVKFDVLEDADPAIISLATLIHRTLTDTFGGHNEKETP